MSKQKWHKFFAQAHKWVGLILGLQLLAWTVGGLVMTWLPINEVRGQHKVAAQTPMKLSAGDDYMGISDLVRLSRSEIIQVSHTHILGQPVAKLRKLHGAPEIRDARTGELLSPISRELAQAIAEADFSLDAPVSSVTELFENNIDYRGSLPVWQVNFADEEQTSLYVSPTQGRIVARRSEMWRVFDFFWMLHIMDYDERADMNNPLVVTTSFFAALFAISGLSLLFFRFYRRDFNFILGMRKR
ncbi:MAG: PepSY domain-containing protein [Kordiimonadaceae bacterium]|nr:PepSY domain-containing protein [Kordiimonadaceae bacterium]